MKKLIFALICTIITVGCSNFAFAAFIKLDAAGQPTENDAACVMVKDDVTNLIWERKTISNKDQTYTWDDAKAYAESLALDGNSGWRLPTIRELLTIIDFAKSTAPAVNADYFPNISKSLYWTSTDYVLGSAVYDDQGNFQSYSSAWSINFSNGTEDVASNKTAIKRVIAVRGNFLPLPTFTVDNSIVKDNNGLIWQKTPGSETKKWTDISTYLTAIPGVQVDNTGCYGWRLPTLQELQTIVNYEGNPAPTSYSEFSAVSAKYWTSTPDAQSTSSSKVWYVDFTNGTIGTVGTTVDPGYRVWAVVDKNKSVTCPVQPDYPKGDITHDTHVDLLDVIAGLKVLDGITVTVYTDTDVNGDGKIGQEEVIYALQVTAALRPQQ